MSVVAAARYEMELAGFDKEETDTMVTILDLFFDQWDSGGAVSVMVPVMHRLLCCKPLSPLTGADHEWFEHKDMGPPCFQNVRCSSVFKDTKDGPAYDIDNPAGKRAPITFPYDPDAVVTDPVVTFNADGDE